MKNRNTTTIFTAILFGLACFALVPGAQAVSPAPDGGYPGGNTAEGQAALLSLTTGGFNTAVGFFSLRSDTTGQFNTALGLIALSANSTGTANTATGTGALGANTGGNINTAIGSGALFSNMNGSLNVALGGAAGGNLTTGDNNIDIGYNVLGVAGESNTIRIGNTDITTTIIRGISGQTIASGSPVLVAANGQLGTMTSSKRFKDEIQPMDKASEALFSLNPVTFRYKKEIDPVGTSQFGL